MNLSENTYRKYTEILDVNDYEILTDEGFVEVDQVMKTIEYEKWNLTTKSFSLSCADTHIVFDENFNEVYVCDLIVGESKIQTDNGIEIVELLVNTHILEEMYDIHLTDDNHRFYTDGILSHNSLVLGNIGVRAFFQKLNVGLYTVELSAAKYMKRLGSNAFNIPYTAYKDITDEESTQIVSEAMKKTKDKYELGNFIIEEGPTGAMTSLDVENFFLQQENDLDIKFDLVLVDYINLLKYYKGEASLYEKIKSISEELRKIAKRNNWCIITATQVKAAYFNADDLFLDSTAESSGLVATVDSLFGLIGSSSDNRIKIKNIANRDEGHMNSYKYFRKVKKYYRLEEDWAQDSEFWPDDDVDTLETAMATEYENLGRAAGALGNEVSMHVDSSIHDIIDNSYKRNEAINKEKMNQTTIPTVPNVENIAIDPEILSKIHERQNAEVNKNLAAMKEVDITDVPFADLPADNTDFAENHIKSEGDYNDMLKNIPI